MTLSPHRVCLGFETDGCRTPRSVLAQDRPAHPEHSPSMLSKALSRRKQRPRSPVPTGSQGRHPHHSKCDQAPPGQHGPTGALPEPAEPLHSSTRPRSACVDIPRSLQRSPTCCATLDEYEQEAVVAAALHCHTPLAHLSYLPGGCRGNPAATGRPHSDSDSSPPCRGAWVQPKPQPQVSLAAAAVQAGDSGSGSAGSDAGGEAAAGGQREPSATGRLFEAQAEAASAKALAQCLLDSLRQERERAEWLLSQLGRVSQERDRLQRELLAVQGDARVVPAGTRACPERQVSPAASSAMPSAKDSAVQRRGRGRRSKAAARPQLVAQPQVEQPQQSAQKRAEKGQGRSAGAGALSSAASGGIRPSTPAATNA